MMRGGWGLVALSNVPTRRLASEQTLLSIMQASPLTRTPDSLLIPAQQCL